eukprot:GHVH01012550.1.p1 GENE.GHVH01012550.1~~GHVH01012550.1.p1  ORF type:complete len:181 (+),score=4.69 GHVH01012550.1:281-823(+)
MPTLSNTRCDNPMKTKMLRTLLKSGTLLPCPPGTQPFLDAIFEPKKDKSYRLVVNGAPKVLSSRQLYSPHIPFSTSVTQAISLLARASIEKPYMVLADLSAGYYQVRLSHTEEQKKLLTTRIQGRVYQWTSPPQGLSASTSVCVTKFVFRQRRMVLSTVSGSGTTHLVRPLGQIHVLDHP